MQTIDRQSLTALFLEFRAVFEAQRDFLIDLDSKVGDSDLGLTMHKAFTAAHESVARTADESISRSLQLAGMAMAKAAPSTMGTLMATGFMRGGKALESCTGNIDTEEMSLFWNAFATGVAERGKAQPGDKTVLDVLQPVAASLQASSAAGASLEDALAQAATVAAQALEATKTMVAQHGKAACFQEKTLGLQDAGATVVFFLIEALQKFAVQNKGSAP